jgi:hypothetical protein
VIVKTEAFELLYLDFSIKGMKVKKLFMVLCAVIMLFGIVGCPFFDNDNDDPVRSATTIVDKIPQVGGDGASPVPEPATLLLIGSGLVGLATYGRKKFKK